MRAKIVSSVHDASLSELLGSGSIKGVVKEMGVNVRSAISCYHKSSGRFIKRTQASIDGSYSFKGLSRDYYFFIIAHHPNDKFNAVIQDNVVPK